MLTKLQLIVALLLLIAITNTTWAKPEGQATLKKLTGWEAFTELTRGNLRFSNESVIQNRDPHAKGLERDRPHTVVLTCSDSRIVPEIIFDQGIGSLYVIRNPGLIVDSVSLGGIEYAVNKLGVELVLLLTSKSCSAQNWRASGGDGKTLQKLSGLIEERKKLPNSSSSIHTPTTPTSLAETDASRIAHWLVSKSEVIRQNAKKRLLLVAQADYDIASKRVMFSRVGQPNLIDNRIEWRKSVRQGFTSHVDQSANPAR